MLGNILEYRQLKDGLYDVSLIISENDYFMVYDNINDENAKELMRNYLCHRQDDGKANNIQIKYNKNRHIVSIKANLHYLESYSQKLRGPRGSAGAIEG